MKGRDHSKDLYIDKEIGWEGVDSMHVAKDTDQWQDLVNMVMNLWVP
jgi:hypothetical protein